MMTQERREKEAKEKAAATSENPEAPESKKENSESKEISESKKENSDGKADSSGEKAEGEKEATIDLRPLTMEDLKEAKNQVSCRCRPLKCCQSLNRHELLA